METAAAIIAFVQITGSIIKLCNDTLDTIKEAPQVVTQLRDEIVSLQSVISGSTPNIEEKPAFQQCQRLLDELKDLFPDNLKIEIDHEANSEPSSSLAGASRPRDKLLDVLSAWLRKKPKVQKIENGNNSKPSISDNSGKRKAKFFEAAHWLHIKPKVQKILAEISAQKATMLLLMADNITGNVQDIKLQVQELGDNLTEQQRNSICDWIATGSHDPTRKFNEHIQDHDKMTSSWVKRMAQWNNWLDRSAESRLVWLHGIPGAGKTILTSFLIDETRKSQENVPGAITIYYYCLFSREKDETDSLLQWVVSQMIRAAQVVPDNIRRLWELKHSPSTSDLQIAISALQSQFEDIHILVDGIDESQCCINMSRILTEFSTSPDSKKFWVLASSRRNSDISSTFKGVAIELSMSNEEVQKDIQTFIHNELRRRRKLERFSHIFGEIEKKLDRQADGMFRLAVCQIDLLERQRTEEQIQNILQNLPRTIFDAYIQIFMAISEDDWFFVRCVMETIIAHNVLWDDPEPLYASVLLPWIEFKMKNAGKPGGYDLINLDDICGCLITLEAQVHTRDSIDTNAEIANNPYNTVIKFSHYTVKEFLESDYIQDPQDSYQSRLRKILKCSSSEVLFLENLQRACELDPDPDFSAFFGGDDTESHKHAFNTECYHAISALDLILDSFYPSHDQGTYLITTGIDIKSKHREEFLKWASKFASLNSTPMRYIKHLVEYCHSFSFHPDRNTRPDKGYMIYIKEYQSCSYAESVDLFRNDMIFTESTILTTPSSTMSAVWQYLESWSIRLGLEILESLEHQELRSVLGQEIHVRAWPDLSNAYSNKIWESSFQGPWECHGTIPEIIAETQFLINSVKMGNHVWTRLWELLDRFNGFVDTTNLLSCYIYSHARDCSKKSLRILPANDPFNDQWTIIPSPTPCCFVEKLLKAGSDPNGSGMLMTPLQVAAQRQDFEGIRLLLEYGADVNGLGSKGGKTCLGWKSEYADWSPLQIFRQAPFEPLYVYPCDCGARLPLRPETHECWKCEEVPEEENDHERYIEIHDEVERMEIEKLLLSKGAEEFIRDQS